jgi:hypothetical protein
VEISSFGSAPEPKTDFVPIPENGTKMRLLSPIDDFLSNTLSTLGSLLDRLEYAASLQQSEGKYQHWGLARTYGEETAHEVIQEVHCFNYLQTLRTPLKVLGDEVNRAAAHKGLDEISYVRDLTAISPKLIPNKHTGGSAKHLESVLAALLKIAQSRKRAIRQAS